ncbi:unnamed protein product [Peronospora belbahrii]|uniref:Uncharacterized protein n=1 Tax=Peronospora belbahrii TaxID=622444 RepID=A0ABN8CVD9_9STRA|nr:unnamed protein product [Peronospora belbahrii]
MISRLFFLSPIQFHRYMMSDTKGPVARRIYEKLEAAFTPQYLDVVNESYMHNVPKGSETHFKQELDKDVHALSILSKTPKQWEANAMIQPSPSCRGGMAADDTKKKFLEDLKTKHKNE